jgi:hypothetical protein
MVGDTKVLTLEGLERRKESRKLKSRKFVTQKHFPKKRMADFVGCAQGHFLL